MASNAQAALITSMATAKLSSLKLQEPLSSPEDWESWKIQIENWAAANKVLQWFTPGNAISTKPMARAGIVAATGVTAVTQILDKNIETWELINRMILGTMRQWVNKTVMLNIKSVTSSIEAWTRLTSLYEVMDMV